MAPDLPADDDTFTLTDYADAVVDAAVDNMGKPRKLIVVGHSFGGFTAPLVADRLPAGMLVLLAGMIPSPGEPPDQWWDNTGYTAAIVEQAQADGGLAGNPDPYVSFLHDVPRELAEEATSRERAHPSATATSEPWPLDAWPHVPTRFVLCSEDRFFPPSFLRRVARDRLGISPDEIAGSHCVPLGRPSEVADILVGYTWPAPTCRTASEHLFTGLSSGSGSLDTRSTPAPSSMSLSGATDTSASSSIETRGLEKSLGYAHPTIEIKFKPARPPGAARRVGACGGRSRRAFVPGGATRQASRARAAVASNSARSEKKDCSSSAQSDAGRYAAVSIAETSVGMRLR